MPKLVLDLNDRRPAWALPAWVPEGVREALPGDWTLQVLETEADGSGDGVDLAGPELLDAVAEAEVYVGYGVPPGLLEAGPGLRWIHSGAAGVGSFLSTELKASSVVLTNSKGIHGPPMGDTALAMMLFFARGLDFATAHQRRGPGEGRWDNKPYYAADHPLTEVSRSTVGIFGAGGIGQEVARRVRALGAEVLAYDRGPEAFADTGRMPQGERIDWAAPGFRALHGPEGFRVLLSESDFMVLAAPETPETRGVFGAAALEEMKPTAVLVNLSRGALVDETALVEALVSGRLRGAGLDVFTTEPLPEDHPLWALPNVIVTPHVSAVTRGFWERQLALIIENLHRYVSGAPLLNQVDKEAGF